MSLFFHAASTADYNATGGCKIAYQCSSFASNLSCTLSGYGKFASKASERVTPRAMCGHPGELVSSFPRELAAPTSRLLRWWSTKEEEEEERWTNVNWCHNYWWVWGSCSSCAKVCGPLWNCSITHTAGDIHWKSWGESHFTVAENTLRSVPSIPGGLPILGKFYCKQKGMLAWFGEHWTHIEVGVYWVGTVGHVV